MVCGPILVHELLLLVWDKINTETERKHLEIFIAIWHLHNIHFIVLLKDSTD